jgi:hypothetical protein
VTGTNPKNAAKCGDLYARIVEDPRKDREFARHASTVWARVQPGNARLDIVAPLARGKKAGTTFG